MGKARTVVCLMLLAIMIPAIIQLWGTLPEDTQPLIEKKYGGWAGVLRLWVFEGWQPGAGHVAGWLNRCIGSFEKKHPGVYIQPEYVEASALAALGDDGIQPPDMVLFPPGALNDSAPLQLLDIEVPVREGFPQSEVAVPVMLGGTLWAYNEALLPNLPNSWQDVEIPPAVLPDEPWRHWSAALLGLCSGQYAHDTPEQQAESSGELDLGLTALSPRPTQTPEPASRPLRCLLPNGFKPSHDAWRDFVNGDASAIPVTQREIRRLQALSDQGRGVEWKLAASGHTFTDQALYISLIDQPNADDTRSLCTAFAKHLLSDDCQGELHRIGAFSVTAVTSGYTGGDPLSTLDAMLRSPDVCVPHPFDTTWREDTASIVREFLGGSGDPADLWRQFRDRIREKTELFPNHDF